MNRPHFLSRGAEGFGLLGSGAEAQPQREEGRAEAPPARASAWRAQLPNAAQAALGRRPSPARLQRPPAGRAQTRGRPASRPPPPCGPAQPRGHLQGGGL